MCGIAGHLAASNETRADEDAVARMLSALVHRGPDDAGGYSRGPVALAQRRLSILDLSAAGRQPLGNEDGSVQVVVNGELYNHAELRRGLLARGHRFASRSDSEVLVHLWEERGPELMHELAGMFALALWDARQGTLLLARDRFGKKPLYWRQTPRGLFFASELYALRLGEPALDAPLDMGALDAYLALQYIPAPRTAFQGIHKLPAAHALVVRAGQTPEVQRYERLSFSRTRAAGDREDRIFDADSDASAFPTCDPSDEVACVRAVRVGLESAVRARLEADVPLGAFLSGGLDSSAIVALMARLGASAPQTFTVGFEGDDAPELPYARAVAKHVGARHIEVLVRAEAERVLPELARLHGEPFGDPSALPTYHLSAVARRHVTVALSGDGGDELFGGYRRYLYARVGDALSRLPRPLRAAASAVGRRLPGARLETARAFADALSSSRAERYLLVVGFLHEGQRRQLYAPDAWRDVALESSAQAFEALLQKSDGADELARLQDLDVSTYLADCILPKVDIASMAHALEVRAPLLDHRLAARVAPLPASLKMRRGRGKHVLREAVRDLLPDAILGRRKRGFDPPLARWLRGPLRTFTEDAVRALEPRGLFNPEATRALLAQHARGLDRGNALYALVMLELFLRENVDVFAGQAAAVSRTTDASSLFAPRAGQAGEPR